MTREEQIVEYANSFKGKGIESDELKEVIRLAIIDGAKWADAHPQEPSLPDNLDEAVEKYANTHYGEFFEVEYDFGEPIEIIVDDKSFVRDAFKAGAKWMAEQGVSTIAIVSTEDGITEEGMKLISDYLESLPDKTEVVLQIRKKTLIF